MFEQDYLMRMLLQFFQAMGRSWSQAEEEDYDHACDTLEDAISTATELDGAALLSLAPESIAQVMRVSGVDPNVTEFVARSMLLESVYLAKAKQTALSAVRAEQARAIAEEYGFELPDDPSDFDAITEGLEEAAAQGGFQRRSNSSASDAAFLNLQDQFGFGAIGSEGENGEYDFTYTFEDPDTYFEPLDEDAKPRFGSWADDELDDE